MLGASCISTICDIFHLTLISLCSPFLVTCLSLHPSCELQDTHVSISWDVKVTVMSDICNPMDYTVHGILQARILKWIAFPLSRGSSKPRD